MSLPETLPIFGHSFTIRVDAAIDPRFLGLCDSTGRQITLSPDACRSVLLHEAVHACFDLSGLSEILAEAHVEAACVAIQNGLFEALPLLCESSHKTTENS